MHAVGGAVAGAAAAEEEEEGAMEEGGVAEATEEARKKAAAEEKKQRELKREMSKQQEVKRQQIRASMTIANFERAKPQSSFCEHLRSKAWGNAYGKGLRCLDCGKELTQTHEELSQQRGIGAGDDPVLVAKLMRHHMNEAAYRTKTQAEIDEIENERIRLEKERRQLISADIAVAEFTAALFLGNSPQLAPPATPSWRNCSP